MKREISTYTLAKIFAAFSQIIFIPIATRQIGLENYAAYNLFIQFVLIMRVLSAEGVCQIILFNYTKKKRFREITNFTILNSLLVTIIINSILFGCLIILTNIFTIEKYYDNFFVFIFCTVSISIFSIFQTIILSQKKLKIASFIEISIALLTIILPVVLFEIFESNYSMYLLGYGLAFSAGAVACFYLVPSNIVNASSSRPDRLSKHRFAFQKRLYIFGINLTITYLLLWFIGVFDRFQIEYVLGKMETGTYVVHNQIFYSPLAFVATALLTALQPYLITEVSSIRIRRILLIGVLINIAGAVLFTVLGSFASKLLELLAPEIVSPDYKLIFTLVASATFGSLNVLVSLHVKTLGRSRLVLLSHGMGCFSLFIINYLFIETQGIWICGFSTFIAFFMSITIMLIGLRKSC